VFTGIVEATGRVTSVDDFKSASRLTISAPGLAESLTVGESVAIDGVCLTVARVEGSAWTSDVMRVTRETTTLGSVKAGRRVNLERALRADSRMGGHFLQGHVDGIATLLTRDSGPEWDDLTFRVPASLTRYVVTKGSIAIDGVSLTVAALEGDRVTVSLIPTTLVATNLGDKRPGDPANVEVDVIGKYVESLLGGRM
jgi:riboflavin synthase